MKKTASGTCFSSELSTDFNLTGFNNQKHPSSPKTRNNHRHINFFRGVVMFLSVGFLALGLCVVLAVALAYRWLFAEQRNHSYGTIVIPGKNRKGPSRFDQIFMALRDAADAMLRPVDWSTVLPRARLVRIDEPTRHPK